MLVTTKGRYALRLMTYIASFPEDQKIALRQASEHEDISLKYLEQLAHALVKDGILLSVRGHGGGYRLPPPPSEIRVGDILRSVEGTTLPVACAGLENGCPREDICRTIDFWAGLDRIIEEYVDGVTLDELV